MAEFYQVNEIKKGVYRITSAEQVYMELFVGEKKALLWDTGYGFGNLKEKVRSITDLPLYIVNSHGHEDHSCGNYQFNEDIFIHPQDIEMCQNINSYEMRKSQMENARKAFSTESDKPESIFSASFEEEYLNGGTGRLVPVEEGHLFELGGITLEVFEIPGHTAGSIGLLYREEKMFYAGDAINQCLWLFLPEALPLSAYIKTLEKAETVDFEELVVSHSPIIYEKSVLKDFMDLALNLDYDNGIPYAAVPDREVHLCIRKGYTEADSAKPGYASIAINKRCYNQ